MGSRSHLLAKLPIISLVLLPPTGETCALLLTLIVNYASDSAVVERRDSGAHSRYVPRSACISSRASGARGVTHI